MMTTVSSAPPSTRRSGRNANGKATVATNAARMQTCFNIAPLSFRQNNDVFRRRTRK